MIQGWESDSFVEQGGREQLEDCVIFSLCRHGCLFGVCDGHGGKKAVELAERRIPEVFKTVGNGNANDYRWIWTELFRKVASETQAFTDGACTAVGFLRGYDISCANVGDCRIIIIGNRVRQLTVDHNFCNSDELDRVIRAGGAVINRRLVIEDGHSINISRAFGDKEFRGLIIAESAVNAYSLSRSDKAIVAMTDGISKVLGNEEVAELVLVSEKLPIEEVAKKIAENARMAGSDDDIGIVVLRRKN